MGQTVAQKIVARAAGRTTVEPGEYVNVSPDYTCCQELSWQARKRLMQEIGVDRVARPDKVIMVVDHTTSAAMGLPRACTLRICVRPARSGASTPI